MEIIRNPAKSRPLSANVRRLMKMERESPRNPDVHKVQRPFTEKDIAYCEMQGEIFMAAIDRGVDMAVFAPMFMNSQLAGVIDYSFSCANGMESDEIATLLQMPLLLKSPEVIVDVTLWLNNLVNHLHEDAPANLAVISACVSEQSAELPTYRLQAADDTDALAEEYLYAYWLGYIYRYECLLHEESSRMVYGAFNETMMRDMYERLMADEEEDQEMLGDTLAESAGYICRKLDEYLVGNLWK